MRTPFHPRRVTRVVLAADDHKTVVALRPPKIRGRSEWRANGCVTRITAIPYVHVAPRPYGGTVHTQRASVVSVDAPTPTPAVLIALAAALPALVAPCFGLWGLLVTAALAATAGGSIAHVLRRNVVRWRSEHHVLDTAEDVQFLNRAEWSVGRVVHAWPRLTEIVPIPDPRPTLAQALWDLSAILVDRRRLRTASAELEVALTNVPAAHPVHADLTLRREHTDTKLAELDDAVDRRGAYLEALAQACERFLAEQHAIEYARNAVREADRVLLETLPPGGLDASEDLAERTGAVLSAYRDLTSHLDLEP